MHKEPFTWKLSDLATALHIYTYIYHGHGHCHIQILELQKSPALPQYLDYYANLFRASLHEVLPTPSPSSHVMESGGIPDRVSRHTVRVHTKSAIHSLTGRSGFLLNHPEQSHWGQGDTPQAPASDFSFVTLKATTLQSHLNLPAVRASDPPLARFTDHCHGHGHQTPNSD
jgi:hypothetical protein